MSNASTLPRYARELIVAMLLTAFVVLTSGCGGGDSVSLPPPSGGNPPVVPPPAPTPVSGIATPTSVAVVTATNAQ